MAEADDDSLPSMPQAWDFAVIWDLLETMVLLCHLSLGHVLQGTAHEPQTSVRPGLLSREDRRSARFLMCDRRPNGGYRNR